MLTSALSANSEYHSNSDMTYKNTTFSFSCVI